MKLTDMSFWEGYWEELKLPLEVDFDFSFDRCLATDLRKYLPSKGSVLEIGCAPGKWLAYLAKYKTLMPSGIEYTEAGVAATIENLNILNIKYEEVILGDFFVIEPDPRFDVVISLGFIEHFSDVEEVIKRHLSWLKPGGTLVLGIPNFTGINGIIQRILNKEIIYKHNLNIMNLDFFESCSRRYNLEKIYLAYTCSFEPALAIPKYRFGNLLQLFTRAILFLIRILRKIRLFDSLNSKYFSSYILAIYKKI